MNTVVKLEYVSLFLLSIFLYSQTQYVWWLYMVLFLLPDIGMIGYFINSKVGAVSYNLTHFLGTAVLLIFLGAVLDSSIIYLSGLIILGHSSVDRIVGYGLKYSDSFKHTHLGWLK
jgi:hypothetical protein